jgi:thioredoxin-dependent peroxiredoxin
VINILMLALVSAKAIGDVAPDFTAVDTDGQSHTLSEMVKSGPVIVAFFPKAFTGG